MRVCLLASGGLDSAVLTADLLKRGWEVHPLFVRCGHFWERAELHWLRRFLRKLGRGPFGKRLKPLTVAPAPVAWALGRHWSLDGKGVPPEGSPWDSVFLPGRNITLLSQAGLLCGRRGLDASVLAVLKGNPFSDATPQFFRQMAAATGLSLNRRVGVLAPFLGLSKRQVLLRGAGLPLELTFSCLRPRGRTACRRCSKCEERERALRLR